MGQHFEHMSAESSRFYSRCINEILLNIYAVQHRYFDLYISDIYNERDREVWRIILPKMVILMQRKLENVQPKQDNQDPH